MKEIVNISADANWNQIIHGYKKYNGWYIVDPCHKDYVSVNGNIYTKDMRTLVLVSDVYREQGFVMPDTVESLGTESCTSVYTRSNPIIFWHVSKNLCMIEDKAIQNNQILDLRHTQCHICHMLHSCYNHRHYDEYRCGRIFENVRFPVGELQGKECSFKVTHNEVFFDQTVIAVFDIDEELYCVPEEAVFFEPKNKYLDLEKTKPVHFKNLLLHENIKDFNFGGRETPIDHLGILGENPNFFISQGCLYSYDKEGSFILRHVDLDVTRLNVVEGTKSIWSGAAAARHFEEVNIPEEVEHIYENAFKNSVFDCDLHIYASQISGSAFNGVTIESLYFHGLQENSNIFLGDIHCRVVDFSACHISKMGGSLNNIVAENIVFPKNLIKIPSAFLISSNIKKLDLRYLTRLTEIGDSAIAYSTIEEIKLSDSITRIEPGAFQNSKLRTFESGALYLSIGDSAFYECEQLTKLVLPNVVKIGKKAFYGCGHLSEIEVNPDADIAPSAFYKTPRKRKKVK